MSTLNSSYKELIGILKRRVAEARHRTALRINKELILLYHHIGEQIIKAQNLNGWRSKVIQQLSKDLSSAFPDMRGLAHKT